MNENLSYQHTTRLYQEQNLFHKHILCMYFLVCLHDFVLCVFINSPHTFQR